LGKLVLTNSGKGLKGAHSHTHPHTHSH